MEDLYNVSDPYGTYQTAGGDKPYEILMRLKAWQNEIRSTISKVNENLGGLHEQQSQILQNIDSIELNVLDIVTVASGHTEQISQILISVGAIGITVGKHTTDIGGHSSQISQLLLDLQGITLNVSSVDSRLGRAEGTLVVQAGLIASKVELTNFTGQTIASMIVQDAYSISLFAQQLNLTGYVTFNSLQTNGSTIIHGGNILTGTILASSFYGDLFEVSRGTSYALSMYASQGSHRIYSRDAAGFRIQSSANLSLQGDAGTVYSNSKFWALAGLEVSGTGQFNSNVSVAGQLSANTMFKNGANVATTPEVTGAISTALRDFETSIVAWANGKFALK